MSAGTPGSVSFLSDLSAPSPFSDGTGPRHARQQYYLGYFQMLSPIGRAQDDPTSSENKTRLSLTYGLRYDYFGAVSERDDRAVVVDPETGGEDQPREHHLGREAHPQPDQLAGVGGDGRVEEAALGRVGRSAGRRERLAHWRERRVAAAAGPNPYADVQWFMQTLVGRLILFGYTWALIHHMLGGIRHLIWDIGYGFGPLEREWLTVATLAGSIGLTILLWIVGYLMMGVIR